MEFNNNVENIENKNKYDGFEFIDNQLDNPIITIESNLKGLNITHSIETKRFGHTATLSIFIIKI